MRHQIRHTRRLLPLLALPLLALIASCSEPSDPVPAAEPDGAVSNPANPAEAGTCYEPERRMTLVNVLAQDPAGYIAPSHEVEVLDAVTGKAFDPPIRATTTRGNGQFILKGLPCKTKAWIHVTGAGPVNEGGSTYDSLGLHVPESGEGLVRISTVGTASSAEATGGFTGKPELVSLGGAVYSVDASGKRVGSVGCATVHVDDEPQPARSVDQRYVASTGLPTTLEKLTQTRRSGQFYFGNLKPGLHKFRVSLDGGATFIGTPLELTLPFARQDAKGEFKSMLVLAGIDIGGPNPTPASCQD
jgi:hypothetical protein